MEKSHEEKMEELAVIKKEIDQILKGATIGNINEKIARCNEILKSMNNK